MTFQESSYQDFNADFADDIDEDTDQVEEMLWSQEQADAEREADLAVWFNADN